MCLALYLYLYKHYAVNLFFRTTVLDKWINDKDGTVEDFLKLCAYAEMVDCAHEVIDQLNAGKLCC